MVPLRPCSKYGCAGTFAALVTIDLGIAQGSPCCVSCSTYTSMTCWRNMKLHVMESRCQEWQALVTSLWRSCLRTIPLVLLTATVEALQLGVDACKAWCDKWRMQSLKSLDWHMHAYASADHLHIIAAGRRATGYDFTASLAQQPPITHSCNPTWRREGNE